MSVKGWQKDPSGLLAGHKHGFSTPLSKSVTSDGISIDPYCVCSVFGLYGPDGL